MFQPTYISERNYYNPTEMAGWHLVSCTGLHGIVLPDGDIACEIAMASNNREPWNLNCSEISSVSIGRFSQGYLPQIFPWDYRYYDREIVIQRALSSFVDSFIPNNIASCTGDNFARWCVTGQEIQPDSEYFGQQLVRPKKGLFILEHHGVGIDGGFVVHINKESDEVHLVSFDEFAQGYDVVPIQYKNPLSPLWARNRAINLIGLQGYDLLKRNCEHIACWCVTGEFKSDQINMGKAVGKAVATGFAAALIYYLSRDDDKNNKIDTSK